MNNSKLRSLWSAGHNVYFKKKNQHNNHTVLSLTCDRNQHVYELSKNQAKSVFDRFVNAVCFTINDATIATMAPIVTLLVWMLLKKNAAISSYSSKEKISSLARGLKKTQQCKCIYSHLRSVYCIWWPVSSGQCHSGSASHLGHSGPIPKSFEHSCRWFQDSPGTPRHSRASGCRRCRSSGRAGYSTWSWRGCPRRTGDRQVWDGL